MTPRILPALVAISFTLFPLWSGPARADEQKVQQLHVRGMVETLGASVLKVKTREGETLDVALADGWKVAAVARAQVSDIKPGDFVGIASMPRPRAATARSKSSSSRRRCGVQGRAAMAGTLSPRAP